jgi:hypothetical protein
MADSPSLCQLAGPLLGSANLNTFQPPGSAPVGTADTWHCGCAPLNHGWVPTRI